MDCADQEGHRPQINRSHRDVNTIFSVETIHAKYDDGVDLECIVELGSPGARAETTVPLCRRRHVASAISAELFQ